MDVLTEGCAFSLIILSAIFALRAVMWVVQRPERLRREEKTRAYRAENLIPDEVPKWASYDAYLKSDVWQAKRTAVLDREDHKCQLRRSKSRCGAKATEVHHTTYMFGLGREPLWCLKAVCRPCHKWIHESSERKRKAKWATSATADRSVT